MIALLGSKRLRSLHLAPRMDSARPTGGSAAREETPGNRQQKESSKRVTTKETTDGEGLRYIQWSLHRDPGSTLVLPLENSIARPVGCPLKKPTQRSYHLDVFEKKAYLNSSGSASLVEMSSLAMATLGLK